MASTPILSLQGVLKGGRNLAMPALSVVVLGAGFGMAARQKGIDIATVGVMSATVFSAGAQFAALGLWNKSLPLFTLVLATLAVNVRYLLYGANLHPWLSQLAPRDRYLSVSVLSDVNWAASRLAYEAGERDAGHLFGGGLAMWLGWLLGTTLGTTFSAQLGDGNNWGLDVVMPAFLACSIVGLNRQGSDNLVVLTSASAAAICALLISGNAYLLVGIAAGGVTGLIANENI